MLSIVSYKTSQFHIAHQKYFDLKAIFHERNISQHLGHNLFFNKNSLLVITQTSVQNFPIYICLPSEMDGFPPGSQLSVSIMPRLIFTQTNNENNIYNFKKKKIIENPSEEFTVRLIKNGTNYMKHCRKSTSIPICNLYKFTLFQKSIQIFVSNNKMLFI